MVHLVVASTSEIPGHLDVATELLVIAELLGREVEGKNELPGLIEESDRGTLNGVEGLELVGGEGAGAKEEHELEAESEEGGVLTGPLSGLSDVDAGADVINVDSLGRARADGHALEAGE